MESLFTTQNERPLSMINTDQTAGLADSSTDPWLNPGINVNHFAVHLLYHKADL